MFKYFSASEVSAQALALSALADHLPDGTLKTEMQAIVSTLQALATSNFSATEVSAQASALSSLADDLPDGALKTQMQAIVSTLQSLATSLASLYHNAYI